MLVFIGAAGIAVFLADFEEFLFHELAQHVVVGENELKLLDACVDFVDVLLQLADGQAGEGAQAHVHDCLGLNLAQAEPFRQAGARGFGGRAVLDDGDHFVDVVHGNHQSFQNVGALAGLAEFELCASHHHFAAVGNECFEYLFEV